MNKAEAIKRATDVINETDGDLDTADGLGQLAGELEEAFNDEAILASGDEDAEDDEPAEKVDD